MGSPQGIRILQSSEISSVVNFFGACADIVIQDRHFSVLKPLCCAAKLETCMSMLLTEQTGRPES